MEAGPEFYTEQLQRLEEAKRTGIYAPIVDDFILFIKERQETFRTNPELRKLLKEKVRTELAFLRIDRIQKLEILFTAKLLKLLHATKFIHPEEIVAQEPIVTYLRQEILAYKAYLKKKTEGSNLEELQFIIDNAKSWHTEIGWLAETIKELLPDMIKIAQERSK